MKRITRRSLIGGGLAAGAAALLPGARRLARAASPPRAKNLVIVFANGGWDVTYALDPKPANKDVDAPAGAVRRFGDLPVFVDASRPKVTAFFAKHASLCAVVNGVQVSSLVHADCWKRVLTGTRSEANPDVGAIVAYEGGRDLPVPYLVLGPMAFTGRLAPYAGRVGGMNQLVTLVDGTGAHYAPPAGTRVPATFALPEPLPAPAERKLIEGYLKAQAERLRATRGARGANRRAIDAYLTSLGRPARIAPFAAKLGRLEFQRSLDKQAALAVDALAGGLSRAVMIDSGSRWDTHDANARQGRYFDTLFAGLTRLVDLLAARKGSAAGSKLLDETAVVVLSEMGRTRKLNAGSGKDHWPVTSALLIGAGVAGGKAYGGTDARLGARPVDLATGEPKAGGTTLQGANLAAGILSLCGVAPSRYLGKATPLTGFLRRS